MNMLGSAWDVDGLSNRPNRKSQDPPQHPQHQTYSFARSPVPGHDARLPSIRELLPSIEPLYVPHMEPQLFPPYFPSSAPLAQQPTQQHKRSFQEIEHILVEEAQKKCKISEKPNQPNLFPEKSGTFVLTPQQPAMHTHSNPFAYFHQPQIMPAINTETACSKFSSLLAVAECLTQIPSATAFSSRQMATPSSSRTTTPAASTTTTTTTTTTPTPTPTALSSLSSSPQLVSSLTLPASHLRITSPRTASQIPGQQPRIPTFRPAKTRASNLSSADRRHKCQWAGCSMSFPTSSELICHIRTHTGEKPYKCEFEGCGKGFAQSGGLVRHRRTHTGDKPYQCQFEGCTKAFSESGHLTRHHRSHTGERPYPCSFLCGKSFATSYHLFRHMKVHSMEGRQQSLAFLQQRAASSTNNNTNTTTTANNNNNNTNCHQQHYLGALLDDDDDFDDDDFDDEEFDDDGGGDGDDDDDEFGDRCGDNVADIVGVSGGNQSHQLKMGDLFIHRAGP